MTEKTGFQGARAPRTNMFIMAAIYADDGSGPVRVRNLSPTGALVEGPVLPLPGSRCRLSRGSLSIMGETVWQQDGRAGLRFEAAVSVADWLPHGRAISGQQRVDEIVQRVKSDSKDAGSNAQAEDIFPQSASHSRAALERLTLEVQSLSEDLAADARAVERHGSKLQVLDIVVQALGRLASPGRR